MKTKKIIGIIFVIVVSVACIITLIILLHGETKTSGQNSTNTKSKSLICESQTVKYPFFDYDNSTAKNLKITANFYNNKINAISLAYTLYYDDARQIALSESSNHADMNISFGKDNLGADAFNAHYAKMEDSMKMNLYIEFDKLNLATAKYFMVEPKDQTSLPVSLSEYQENYKKQGLNCEIGS